ncbi:DUF6146 family protein [Hanstruepera flava]|uniref:DUF6146 family protein n=1 Tax=Hanstruepera flava TaxID=2930218 RepID=UPI002027F2D6|nr:DUF6146 family protein [Hanstruepera flava]
MKALLSILIIALLFASCKTNNAGVSSSNEVDREETQDTIRIANDELEYEVIIIDSGFDSWMLRRARPKSYYTQSFLEARNIQYVTEWNRRVVTSGYNTSLYDMQINYTQGVDYGFDVNYTLYHYFVFFEEKYNQKLTTHNPRF